MSKCNNQAPNLYQESHNASSHIGKEIPRDPILSLPPTDSMNNEDDDGYDDDIVNNDNDILNSDEGKIVITRGMCLPLAPCFS